MKRSTRRLRAIGGRRSALVLPQGRPPPPPPRRRLWSTLCGRNGRREGKTRRRRVARFRLWTTPVRMAAGRPEYGQFGLNGRKTAKMAANRPKFELRPPLSQILARKRNLKSRRSLSPQRRQSQGGHGLYVESELRPLFGRRRALAGQGLRLQPGSNLGRCCHSATLFARENWASCAFVLLLLVVVVMVVVVVDPIRPL